MNATDYNKLFESEAERLRGRKLLLHCCCAPCTLGVIERVVDVFDLSLFWYNPNIMPEEEHDRRLGELKKVSEIFGVELIVGKYDNAEFLKTVAGYESEREGGSRCGLCIEKRLAETSRYASENGFDLFATTLTVSPHKNAVAINLTGERLSDGAAWLHSDFKKKSGFLRSGQLCEKYGVYRQNYCGCRLQ